jgi:hypothetical protein
MWKLIQKKVSLKKKQWVKKNRQLDRRFLFQSYRKEANVVSKKCHPRQRVSRKEPHNH